MRELRGYKLIDADNLEAFFRDFFPDLSPYRRLALEEFWRRPAPHEERFHRPTSYLSTDSFEPVVFPMVESRKDRHGKSEKEKRRLYIERLRARTEKKYPRLKKGDP